MLSHLTKLWMGAALLVAAGFFSGSLQAEPKSVLVLDEPAKLSFYWQSLSPSKTGHSLELSDLYDGLHNLRTKGWGIATETVPLDPAAPQVTHLSKSKKLYDGISFPPGLKTLLCDMNPAVCNRECKKDKSVDKDFCHGSDAYITIPKVTLEPLIVTYAYKKRKVDTLEGIVVKDRQGCEVLDERCKQEIVNLNGGNKDVLSPNFAGFLRVPTKVYSATFEIKAPPGYAAVYRLGDQEGAPVLMGLTDPAIKELKQELSKSLRNVRLLNVTPVTGRHYGGIQNGGGACDPGKDSLPIDRLTMLKMIKHPAVMGGKPPIRRNIIALFDGWIHEQHCELKLASFLNKREIPIDNPAEGKCGVFGRGWHPDDMHATHLAGLIATNSKSRQAAVNKNANVHAVDVAPGLFKTGRQKPVIDAGNDIMTYLQQETVPVANLSWFYSELKNLAVGEFDSIRLSIKVNRTLFVTAAGNHGEEHPRSAQCSIFPACFEYQNILSVVAASRTLYGPALLKCSNRGMRHDVIAPGAMIWSSYPGNARNEASGTSQASAIAAGAASLLKSKCLDMKAPAIAARMILTSDFYEKIDPNAAFGGMINLQKALRTDVQQLTYIDKSGNTRTLLADGTEDKDTKEILSGFDERDLRIKLLNAYNSSKDASSPETRERSMSRILRIAKIIDTNPSKHRYVIFAIGNGDIKNIPNRNAFHRLHGGEIRFSGPAKPREFRFKGRDVESNEVVEAVIPEHETHRLIDFVRRDYAKVQCRGDSKVEKKNE